MTINLETEIVASRVDTGTQTAYYTIARNGHRYTAAIPLADLNKRGATLAMRRNHIANALETAARGEPDVAV